MKHGDLIKVKQITRKSFVEWMEMADHQSSNFSAGGLNMRKQNSAQNIQLSQPYHQGNNQYLSVSRLSPSNSRLSPARFSPSTSSPQEYARRRRSVTGALQRASLSRASSAGASTGDRRRSVTVARRGSIMGGLVTQQSQGQGGSARAFNLLYGGSQQPQSARSNRGFHYRKMQEEIAKKEAIGGDTAEVEQLERVKYEYVQENYDEYLTQLSKKQEMASKRSPVKQAIIQKMYGDVIVGKYYNVQMRGGNQPHVKSDAHSTAMLFDPVFFADDTGERRLQARQNMSRPTREPRPMFIGPDGKLHPKIDTLANDPHQNRMMAILSGKGSPTRTRTSGSPGRGSPMYAPAMGGSASPTNSYSRQHANQTAYQRYGQHAHNNMSQDSLNGRSSPYRYSPSQSYSRVHNLSSQSHSLNRSNSPPNRHNSPSRGSAGQYSGNRQAEQRSYTMMQKSERSLYGNNQSIKEVSDESQDSKKQNENSSEDLLSVTSKAESSQQEDVEYAMNEDQVYNQDFGPAAAREDNKQSFGYQGGHIYPTIQIERASTRKEKQLREDQNEGPEQVDNGGFVDRRNHLDDLYEEALDQTKAQTEAQAEVHAEEEQDAQQTEEAGPQQTWASYLGGWFGYGAAEEQPQPHATPEPEPTTTTTQAETSKALPTVERLDLISEISGGESALEAGKENSPTFDDDESSSYVVKGLPKGMGKTQSDNLGRVAEFKVAQAQPRISQGNNNNNEAFDNAEESLDLSQFRPGSSDDERQRSDYQEILVCDVNSHSDVSLEQKRLLNAQLRRLKNQDVTSNPSSAAAANEVRLSREEVHLRNLRMRIKRDQANQFRAQIREEDTSDLQDNQLLSKGENSLVEETNNRGSLDEPRFDRMNKVAVSQEAIRFKTHLKEGGDQYDPKRSIAEQSEMSADLDVASELNSFNKNRQVLADAASFKLKDISNSGGQEQLDESSEIPSEEEDPEVASELDSPVNRISHGATHTERDQQKKRPTGQQRSNNPYEFNGEDVADVVAIEASDDDIFGRPAVALHQI